MDTNLKICLKICLMWNVYGKRRNVSQDYGREKFFLAIVEFHKMSTNVHQMSKLGHFQ